jgi:hypothetical protein
MRKTRMKPSGFKATSRLLSLTVAFTALTATACNHAAADSIAIEREVLLSKSRVVQRPVVIRTPDNGFVVAGDRLGAWAARVRGDGQPVWEFVDKADEPNVAGKAQSKFIGAVVLDDDSVLLCGSKQIPKAGVGLLVRIDPRGQVVDTQYLRPNGDSAYFYSRIEKCLPWGDGFAVLGFGSKGEGLDGQTTFLIKLDSRGKKVWEKNGPDYSAEDAIETSSHDLVLAMHKFEVYGLAKLVRVNPSGDIVASIEIKDSPFFFLVHSATSGVKISFGADQNTKTTLFTFDPNFKETAPPRTTKTNAFSTARADELADGSLTLFGHVRVSGGNGGLSAAIARVADINELEVQHIFQPLYQSFSANDAVPLAPGKFLVVRDSVSQDPSKCGVLMSWVSVR